jgi:hypothetical protein
MGYVVEEMRKDGSWQRCAQAHVWETAKDAHRQCSQLRERHPDRIYAVTESNPDSAKEQK